MPILLYIRGAAGSGLSLGWLLTIAIGGGVLVFLGVALLLLWRLKGRAAPITTRVYATDMTMSQSTRLTKRRLLTGDGSTSRFSSRLSVSLPPVSLLPPLPSYSSFKLFRGEKSLSKGWVDEDALHGPKMGERARQSWFASESSTFDGRAPTLPSFTPTERDQAHYSMRAEPESETRDGGQLEVRKLRVQRSQEQEIQAPLEPQEEDAPRGRARVPAQSLMSCSATDTDLKDILRLTEQRLRDGTSRSPEKTPGSSPRKAASPTKTPRSCRSCRTTASQETFRTARSTRQSASPVKVLPGETAEPSDVSQHGTSSSSSISGSAADDLLAEAAQQLSTPDSSPSRARGQVCNTLSPQKTPQTSRRPQQPSPQSRHGRYSLESDASSSLSTLYSASEPDEAPSERTSATSNDPFIEDRNPVWGLTSRSSTRVSGPRPLKKVAKRFSSSISCKKEDGDDNASVVPAPLRPLSANTHIGLGRDASRRSKLSLVLPSPSRHGAEERSPLKKQQPSITPTSSESSMVTVTVHSDSEDGYLPELVPELQGRQDGSKTSGMHTSTPVKVRDPDMSSSPYDENDILEVLLAGNGPKRALPSPPRRSVTAEGTILSTPLSPPPGHSRSSPFRNASKASGSSSSSIYDESIVGGPDAATSTSPSRRSTVRSTQDRDSQAVGSTIAELRRMDSMVSSYSLASIASTIAETPSLPNLSNGFLSGGTAYKPGAISSRHYFNIGQTSPKNRTPGGAVGGACGRTTPIREQESHASPNKENEGQASSGVRMPRIDVTSASPLAGLRQTSPRGLNSGRESPTPASGVPKPRPVQELLDKEEQAKRSSRDSVDSLGLYDKDGFLIASPDRATVKGRWLRM